MTVQAGSRPIGVDRRTFLTAGVLVGAMPLLVTSAEAARTPAAIEGPYYPSPSMRFDDTDFDLTVIRGVNRRAKGVVLDLRGKVVTRDDMAVRNAKVEIWQCDANGRYIHSRDFSFTPRDDAFQGYGQVTTGQDGRFFFRTIQPVAYPGRTPHIHMKVTHAGATLTTQFYNGGDERNARDGLFRRMSEADRQLVTMNFVSGPNGLQTSVTVYL